MYRVEPRRLYVMEWALSDERCVERMDRMVAAMGRRTEEVVVLRERDLPDVIREAGWVGECRQGAYKYTGDPDILFTAMRWLEPAQRSQIARSDLFKRCLDTYESYGLCKQNFTASRTLAMFGAAPFYHYERRPQWSKDQVCWSLRDLHSCWGCFHRCAYCQRGSVYVIGLNVEEFIGRVNELVDEVSWQKTFRYDVEQDVFGIEPEYGACELLVHDFAHRSDQYLILFTKSASVDWLLDFDHRGHTIMLWTLSTHTVSRQYEAKSGTMEERIEAARKCQDAGYTIRFKCKPIIPLRGWREEITQMLETLFAVVEPDNLSLEMVFFDSVHEMDETLGLENLAPEFVAAAERAEAEAQKQGGWRRDLHGPGPFPFEVKHTVYRHFIAESKRLSPSTPVTLCAETQRMWAALDDLLEHKPWNYVCNCGPHCTPGLRQVTHVEGPDAERIGAAVAAGAIPQSPPAS